MANTASNRKWTQRFLVGAVAVLALLAIGGLTFIGLTHDSGGSKAATVIKTACDGMTPGQGFGMLPTSDRCNMIAVDSTTIMGKSDKACGTFATPPAGTALVPTVTGGCEFHHINEPKRVQLVAVATLPPAQVVVQSSPPQVMVNSSPPTVVQGTASPTLITRRPPKQCTFSDPEEAQRACLAINGKWKTRDGMDYCTKSNC